MSLYCLNPLIYALTTKTHLAFDSDLQGARESDGSDGKKLLYAPNTGADFFKILAVSLVLSLLLLPMTEMSGVEIMKEVEIFCLWKRCHFVLY
jgi:hypothetical protein